MKVRHPYVAGAFYEASPQLLRKQIEQCFLHKLGPKATPQVADNGPRRIIGLISPHAGYMYSGPVAAHAYYSLAMDGRIDLAVILGPNHSGYGSALAIMREGVWRTPLGDVEVDREVADEIVKLSNIVDVDEVAHRYEHSIEVQIPFLQYIYDSAFRIVPVCFMM
ncbi:AmmeMemoRadiSam system protein B, partial [Candidatus Bathyarchaeota archaeon]|nr:AmmeMemoRadiSam system protein B [Candidatus Bathyarchaeota archaeon]